MTRNPRPNSSPENTDSLRPALLTVVLSSGIGLIYALSLGNPLGLLVALSGPLILGVGLIERVAQRRSRGQALVREVIARDAHRPDPLLVTRSGELPVTWWLAGLAPPSERAVRLGVISHPASSLIAGASRRSVTRVLAVDLGGGIIVRGPRPIAQAVVRALRVSVRCEYSPDEVAPGLSLDADFLPRSHVMTRWQLTVDGRGFGTLVDRLRLQAPVEAIVVDAVPEEYDILVDHLSEGRSELNVEDIDVMREGPHALVAGMTGSGKTEFLVSWIAHLAHSFDPAALAVAIFDFKGGGSFARVAVLEHVRHVVTDLDPAMVRAALDGLRGLVIRREMLMRTHGVPDIELVAPAVRPPRVVVVVDEFRVVAESYPDALSLFVDLAARGRALGIHTITASQKFAGSGMEALAANCSLRIAFRMTDVADCRAFLERTNATTATFSPGVATVVSSATSPRRLRVDLVTGINRGESERADPLWLEPLAQAPTLVGLRHKPDNRVVLLGLHDNQVLTQRQPVSWNPSSGLLLIVGGRPDDRATLAGLAADQLCIAPLVLPASPIDAWDALFSRDTATQEGLIVPHLDQTMMSLPAGWREDFVDEVYAVASRLVSQGRPSLLGVSADGSLSSRFVSLGHTRIELDSGSGVEPGHTLPTIVRARVEGRIFTVLSHAPVSTQTTSLSDVSLDDSCVVVTPRVRSWAHLGAHGVTVVTPEEWLFRSSGPTDSSTGQRRLFLHDCSPADARALRVSPFPLPPPHPETLFEVTEAGDYVRLRVPVSLSNAKASRS